MVRLIAGAVVDKSDLTTIDFQFFIIVNLCFLVDLKQGLAHRENAVVALQQELEQFLIAYISLIVLNDEQNPRSRCVMGLLIHLDALGKSSDHGAYLVIAARRRLSILIVKEHLMIEWLITVHVVVKWQ